MENIIIRKAQPDEAERLIDINIEVWNTTYKDIIPQKIIDKLQTKNQARIERNKKSIKEKKNTFVAEINGKIVGYSTYGKIRDENYNNAGEIYASYILDDYQKLGIGRKLAIACMEEMIKDGYTTLITKCLEGNPSNEFHKSLGGIFVGQSSFDPLGIHVGIANIYYHENLSNSLKYNKEKIKDKNNHDNTIKLYRGTKISGLKEMQPKLVNHDKPYVYATTDKIEALIYSVKGGNLNYTNIYGYDDDNKRCLIERKENYLEKIYNTEGRYYILDKTNFKKHDELGVGENEYVSELPVKVIEEVIIPNVWEYFKNLETNNKLKIYRYPNRPKLYPKDDTDLIECAIIMYCQTGDMDSSFDFLLKYHPELLDRVNIIKKEIKTKSKECLIDNIKYFK